MRILVVGPGALGICFAARLAASGHSVHLGCRNKERAAEHHRLVAVDSDGQQVISEVPAVWRAKDVGNPVDALILATKIDAAPKALKSWLPALKKDGLVVSLLNGLQGDTIAALCPDQFVACTVAFPATLESTGRSRQTGSGELILGLWPNQGMNTGIDLEPLAQALTAVAPTRIHANMEGVQWSKLLVNSASTTLGALTGLDFGALLEDPRARRAFLRIYTEGLAAGVAEGVAFEKMLGIEPTWMALPPLGSRLPLRNLILAVMRRKFRQYRSSSLQSRLRGQRSEAIYLNGAISEVAKRHSIPTPVNDLVLQIMTAIDDGRLEPDVSHLARLDRA